MSENEEFGVPARPTRPGASRQPGWRDARRDTGKSSPIQADAVDKIASLFKNRQQQYTSVLKSLETIGLEPVFMHIRINDKLTQCLVVPTEDLVYKEWQHMTQSNFGLTELQTEENDDQ